LEPLAGDLPPHRFAPANAQHPTKEEHRFAEGRNNTGQIAAYTVQTLTTFEYECQGLVTSLYR
jgi:hypothetical protein